MADFAFSFPVGDAVDLTLALQNEDGSDFNLAAYLAAGGVATFRLVRETGMVRKVFSTTAVEVAAGDASNVATIHILAGQLTVQGAYSATLTTTDDPWEGSVTVGAPGSSPSVTAAGLSTSPSLPDASATAKGAVRLAGDLGGTAAAPEVRVTHLAAPLPEAQGGTGALSLSTATVLAPGASTPRSLAARAGDVVNVKDWGAVGDGVTDDTAAIQAAVAAAVAAGRGEVRFPAGVFMVAAPIAAATSGVHFVGAGPSATTVKALTGFAGSALFILGNKSTTTVTGRMRIEGMTLDANAVDGVSGFEMYGLRDGSGSEAMLVTGFKNAPGIVTGQAGAGAGQASGRMNQGLTFLNVHAITFQAVDGRGFWELDGIFESTLVGCKALGSSSVVIANAAGFRVGHYSESRALTMIGVTAGNLKDTGDGSAKTNVGIHYGQWARDCRDFNTSFEAITGSAVYFHGSQTSGTRLPYNCESSSPRVYVHGSTGTDGYGHDVIHFFNPVMRFGDAGDCRVGPIANYDSGTKTWVRFDAPVVADGQQRNNAEIVARVNPATLPSAIVSFDANCAASNWVYGRASANDNAHRQFWLNRANDAALIIPQIVDGAGNQMLEFSPTLGIIPRTAFRNTRVRRFQATYGATVLVNLSASGDQRISVTDGNDFTIANPTNGIDGDRLTIRVRNLSGGALGTITWDTAYKMAAWSSPANGYSRAIEFEHDGTIWIERWRTPNDVPN